MSALILIAIFGLAATPSVTVRVEAKPGHLISPGIYGASAVSAEKARELGLTSVRWGGNRTSRFNWKTQADNAGSDWFFLNGKASSWNTFVTANRRAGIGSYLTVPMLSWVAKGADGYGFSVGKYGPQQKVEPYVSDRGNGIRLDGSPVTGNDPRDTSVASTSAFQAEGIKGLSLPDDGLPRLYGLDNEPTLWNHTHRDVHPDPASYDELLTRGRDLAAAIKAVDPQAIIAGPCTWGWTDLTYSALDEGKDRYATHPDRRAHGNMPFLAWYLAQMNRASTQAGKRLLDAVDVHYYPQGKADGQLIFPGKTISDAIRGLRLRSTRGLWDKTYQDESWINEPVVLILRVRAWIDAHYPGTKLAIGEYSWGGDDDPSGAIAQTEILGIFARERVDYAYFWAGLEGVQRFAFQLYRNPDGRHKGFGSTYLNARSDAPDRVSAFAALRVDGATTIVLINKDLKAEAEVRLDLGGVTLPTTMDLFRLPNPPGPIRREAWPAKEQRVVTLPPLSACLVVIPKSKL